MQKLTPFSKPKGPVVLIIMDGVGLGKPDDSNAVHLAKTPVIDRLQAGPLYTQLKAHGTAVGMPTDDDMGNSEVGHNALGAGRIIDQGAKLVKNALESSQAFESQTWQNIIDTTERGGTFHLIGLLSDGNVHAHISHVEMMVNRAAEDGVKSLRLHALLDGRDVAEKSALIYLKQIEALFDRHRIAGRDYRIASGGGRMITTMDRYNADWTIVERGWKAHVLGQGDRAFSNAIDGVQSLYEESIKHTDQYLPSFVITENDVPIGPVEDGDAVLFYNFRGDRAIELCQAFESEDFDKFDRVRVPKIFFSGMTLYDGDLQIPKHYLVAPPAIDQTISTFLCAEELRSFALSETQKYGHVTYFWNGNKSGYIREDLETYVEIKSDLCPFDEKPKMKAIEITEKALDFIQSGQFDFGRINYPNGDMVGHTGDIDATITSVEITDWGVGQIIDAVQALGGVTVVLADHGNADEMFTFKNGVKTPKTAHTLNPVPCAIVMPDASSDWELSQPETPGLTNIAATLCNLLGYKAPDLYDTSLIQRKGS